MSDSQKRIILDVQIKTSDSVKRLAEVRKEQEALRESNKKLAKAQGDNGEAIALNEARLRELSKEQGRLQNIMDLSTKSNKANTGSLDQMRAQLSLMKITYAALTKEERENLEIGVKQQQAIKKLSDEIEDIEKAYGTASRGVGKYKEGILDAVKSLNVFGINVGQVSDQLGSGTKNVKGFLGGVTSVRGALTALVAVPIVAFLVGVVALLKKTQAGQEFLSKGFAAGGAAVDVLVSKVIGFSTAVADAFSKPGELVESFKNTLKELGEKQLANFLSGLQGIGRTFKKLFAGEFVEAGKEAAKALYNLIPVSAVLDKVGSSVKGLSGEMLDAGKAAFDLEGRIISMERESKRLQATITRLNAEFEAQTTIADDATRSFKEREQAAERARKLAAESAQLQSKIARAELALINEQVAAKKRLGIADGELKDKQREATLKVIELEGQFQKTLLDNNKQRRELVQDRLEKDLDILIDGYDNQKSINERILQDDRVSFAERRRLLEETAELGAESFDKQIQTIQQFTGKAVDATNLLATADAKALNEKIRGLGLSEIIEGRLLEIVRERRTAVQDLAEAEKDLNAGQSEQYLEGLDKQREALAGFFEQRQEQRQADLDAGRVQEMDAQNGQLADELILLQSRLQLSKTFEEEITNSTILSAEQRKEALAKLGQEQLQIAEEVAAKEFTIAQKNARDQNAIIEAKYQTAKAFTDGVGQLFGLLASSQEEAAEIQKVFTLGQIGIDTAKAISALTASSAQVSAAIATASGPAGVVTGPAAYAAYYGSQIITILSNIAQAKKLLSFYDGGFFGYTGDGVPTQESAALGAKPYTYHQRELIVPDRVLSTPAGRFHGGQLLSMMRATMPEHRVKGFANGGVAPAAASVAASVGAQQGSDEMAKKIGQEVLAGIMQMPPQVLQVSELERVQDRRKTKASGGLR